MSGQPGQGSYVLARPYLLYSKYPLSKRNKLLWGMWQACFLWNEAFRFLTTLTSLTTTGLFFKRVLCFLKIGVFKISKHCTQHYHCIHGQQFYQNRNYQFCKRLLHKDKYCTQFKWQLHFKANQLYKRDSRRIALLSMI